MLTLESFPLIFQQSCHVFSVIKLMMPNLLNNFEQIGQKGLQNELKLLIRIHCSNL